MFVGEGNKISMLLVMEIFKSDVLKFLSVKSSVLPAPTSGKSEQTNSQWETSVPHCSQILWFPVSYIAQFRGRAKAK